MRPIIFKVNKRWEKYDQLACIRKGLKPWRQEKKLPAVQPCSSAGIAGLRN
jgi:hypothetical protein